jgi:hypothetical protein
MKLQAGQTSTVTLEWRSPLLLGRCWFQLRKSCRGANMAYSRAERPYVVLFGTSLSWCALPNASRIAENYFDVKSCSRMNTPCSHLHNFCATGLSRGLATSVTLTLGGCCESLLHGGAPASGFIFVPLYVIVVGLRFKWYSLYNLPKITHKINFCSVVSFCSVLFFTKVVKNSLTLL